MRMFITSAALLLLQSFAADAFQTSTQILPLTVDRIPREEVRQRLGLKESDVGALSIGSGPNMSYGLRNEHEVSCPVSGAHQGVLCTAVLEQPPSALLDTDNAESIANNHELVSQAILSGSLAASVRSQSPEGSSVYYLPYVVTLVESLMADEIRAESLELLVGKKDMVFNSGGLETNEILVDLSDGDLRPFSEGDDRSVMLYACNTQADATSATSDVYLLPRERKGKVWRFSVEYKVASINLRQILSFGNRDSSTPLRPDVWLKDDYY